MYRRFLFVVVVVAYFAGCGTMPQSETGEEPVEHPEEHMERPGEHPEEHMWPPEPSANRHFIIAQNLWDDPEMAIENYSIAIDIRPDFALAYFYRAHLFHKLGHPERAIDDFSRAIELDAGFVQAYLERGSLRMWEMGDDGGAEDFERAYSIDPNDLEAAIAFAGLIERDNPDEAREIYGRMTEVHPHRPEAFVQLAKFFLRYADYGVAAEVFSRAIEFSPEDGWLYTQRGHALLLAGDYDGARRDAEIAADLDPNNPEAQLLGARLAALAGELHLSYDLYNAYFEQEWFDPHVLPEAAYLHAAKGLTDQAQRLIGKYVGMKDDELGARLAGAGVAALAGRTGAARDELDQLILEHEWFLPAWLMRAALAADETGERAQEIIREATERVAGVEPSPHVLFPEHIDLWIWVELYMMANPAVRELELPRP